jgi:hypothetical protein
MTCGAGVCPVLLSPLRGWKCLETSDTRGSHPWLITDAASRLPWGVKRVSAGDAYFARGLGA